MNNYFCLILIALALSACSTYQTKSENTLDLPKDRALAFQDKTEQTSAEIMLVRDQGLAASACYYAVHIDQKIAARMDVAEKASFYLKPGVRKIKVTRDTEAKGLCGEGKDQIEKEITLKSGEVQKYRLTLDLSGQPSLNTYIE